LQKDLPQTSHIPGVLILGLICLLSFILTFSSISSFAIASSVLAIENTFAIASSVLAIENMFLCTLFI
jgi:hypothetical protein